MASPPPPPPPPVSSEKAVAIIFRYADWVDVLLMVLGTVGAVGDGMSTNVLLLYASRIMNSLGFSGSSFMAEVEKVSTGWYLIYIHNE